MRKEPFFINDFVHIYNRGNRKQEIVRDGMDREYFLQALYYFNSKNVPKNPFYELNRIKDKYPAFSMKDYMWPTMWPRREPLVKIFAFILLENHFHLLLQEIQEGGVTSFMRRFGTGMTNRFNTRYQETGRLFQGVYKSKRIDSDNYLRYIGVYIQIKNAFDMYPGGLRAAIGDFDAGYAFASRYPYGSLSLRTQGTPSPLVETDVPIELSVDTREYKEFSRNCTPFMSFDEKKCSLVLSPH